MAPKVKITREAIVNAALELVRQQGWEAINARAIAGVLGCSTQPVFSNYATMNLLKEDVIALAGEIYGEYMAKIMENEEIPKYKASGLAYIGFARDESELFKLLFMRKREGEDLNSGGELWNLGVQLVSDQLSLQNDKAQMFHLEMWVYVHGIASMMATSFLKWDDAMISRMLTDEFLSLKGYYGI